MVMKKLALVAVSAMLATTVAFAASARPAYAANTVDCDAVMKEVAAGTHAKDIAKDLNISTSSVYRCKRHAKASAKAATKSLPQAKIGTGVPAAPAMEAPSPAAAASPTMK